MPLFDDKHVKICGCMIVWDGITLPDEGYDGKPKYVLKVAVPESHPDVALLNQLADTALRSSDKFHGGVLPPGGRMPVNPVGPADLNGQYPGYVTINAKSNRLPDVFSDAGQLLDPMQYNRSLYQGQMVDILVHCYAYDNMGNKGVAAGLDGLAIHLSANAPKQRFSGNGVDTASAFGGGSTYQAPQQFAQQPMGGSPAPQYAQQQPSMQPPVAQQPQQFAQQPMGGSPAPQYAQQQVMQPAQGQQPMQPQQDQAIIQPMPAHNMLPGQS